ncbi:helicase-related protein [Deinococcus sp. UR1]|uniref:helicase-related protein n=1 Tax=Deinococcus sp. UR1 TaxID=1704277 RepID=UPI000C17FF8D|nr:helicase-related protein [Deinococcus sp. UR1]PIG96909.1 helicase related protein [Deinococcus sp. UR1]
MLLSHTLWTPDPLERDGWRALAHVSAASDVLAKADAGERWITLHPHGETEHGGVAVKIKTAPDGTAHIVSGPGALRGLRLTHLASPEELHRRRKERNEARKAQAEADKEAASKAPAAPADPEQEAKEKKAAQEREARLQKLQSDMAELHGKLLDHAADITGDQAYRSDRAAANVNPEDYRKYADGLRKKAVETALDGTESDPDDDAQQADIKAASGAGAVIASRNVRQISSSLKGLRRKIVEDLVKDKQLRSLVLGEEGELDPDAGQTSKPARNLGYKDNTGQQAAAQGFTPEDAREQAQDIFKQRMDALRNDGEHEKADAIEEMRDRTIARAKAERELRSDDPADDGSTLNTPAPRRDVTPAEVAQHAEKVKKFLELHDQLAALEREKRAVTLGHDPAATDAERTALDELDLPPVTSAQLNANVQDADPEFAARLEREIKDAAEADVTRAFLDMAHQGEGGEGHADALIRQRMQAHIGAGAHAHLNNVALSALGREGVDRQVVDALGIEAAAQLIAHAIHQGAQDPATLRDVLAQHHEATSIPRMQEAMNLATAARADVAELELPAINSSTDAAVVRDLQRQRRAAISAAHSELGSALGSVEAGAALNLAMKGKPRADLTVSFQNPSAAHVATQLRALGLQDGDYDLQRDPASGALRATIKASGMTRLMPPLDPERERIGNEVGAIKSGQRDEADYLPAGFMARNTTDLTENPDVPSPFQQNADWQRGPEAVVQDVAASMHADGYKPSEIMQHLLDTVGQDCPEEHRGQFSAAVTDLIPFATTEERIARDGKPYTAHVARDVDNDPDIAARLEQISQQWLADNHPGEPAFHAQHVEDDETTREALFRAIVARPALQAAYAEPGDLGGTPEGRERARAIQNYYHEHVSGRLGGKNPKEYDRAARAAQDAALQRLGDPPEKWGGATGMLFSAGPASSSTTLTLSPHATPEQQVKALAAYGLRPEHYTLNAGAATLNDAGRAALTIPAAPPTLDGTPAAPPVLTGGMDDLNPAWLEHTRKVAQIKAKHPTLGQMWSQYRDTLGGTRNAYASVQEVMQHDLAQRFVTHHAALTGRQLRVSKATTQHWQRRLAATNPEEADRIRQRDRALADQLRTRDTRGMYLNMGEGGLSGAVQEHIERQARQANLMGNLFGLDASGKGGGEVVGRRPADLDVGAHERLTLGRSAEHQLGRMLNGSSWGVKPTDSAGKLHHNLTWGAGTKHVTKQRAVKMLLTSGRMAGWLGAGSGKTGTMLGAYTQARSEGKARKALYVVPSIVRNQFGEAAAKFTEPGRYSWHAEDASYADRKGHYAGSTDMVVVTHQTFRDDMLKLLGEHQGMTPDQVGEWFGGMPREQRAAAFGEAMRHHGIPLDMLHVDEAHDFLNRAGKKDSTMSKVLEAALDNAKYKALWTGSPVKNDASEVHDWLAKLDPQRFGDRDEFIRRYGVNTKASSEALQRLVDKYSIIDSVRPDVEREVTWGQRGANGAQAIPLTQQQQQAYQGVHDAFERASSAARRGQVDVDALRTLSPRSFEGQPATEHADIAGKLQSALGTLKHAALGRVVNEHDPASNAKVQHVLSLAGERKGRGGVIFARNRRSIAMLKEQLEAKGHRVGVIDGSTSTDDKGKVRKAFDAGHVDIVLCSDAGATGANLQHRGEWLVNYDLPLTQKTLEQRNARIDRLGQTKKVELHHLVTDTPYDRDNVTRLNRKRELGSILQGEYRDMEDTGLAGQIRRARAERDGDTPESWEEPLGPAIHENAAPAAPATEAEQLHADHSYDAQGAMTDLMTRYGPTGQAHDVFRQYGDVLRAAPGMAGVDVDKYALAPAAQEFEKARAQHEAAAANVGPDGMRGQHVYGSFRRPLDSVWAGDLMGKGRATQATDTSANRAAPFTAAHTYLSTDAPLSEEDVRRYDLRQVHRPEWPLPATGGAAPGRTSPLNA